MISRWLISFSLVLCSAAGATVTGAVSLVDSLHPAVQSGRDFSGVVVWLEPVGGGAGATIPVPARAQIVQKNKKFLPHILAVSTGTTVDFPNKDPIFHNAFSNFEGKVFDIGLYAPGTSRSVRLDRPGIVRVFCNIHPTMSAVVVVLATPHFALTNAEGRFQITNVPAGEYALRFFHERATASTLEAAVRRFVARETTTALPSAKISESGFLPLRHKNKYGKDYPPTVEDSFYPGAKK